MAMIAIIDYSMGNLRSVQKAFEKVGADTCVTQQIKDIRNADKVVLPGVGAMLPAMEKLKALDLVSVIKEMIQAGKPFLGICLGFQLLFEKSNEGGIVQGLGALKGNVERFSSGMKVPHMGWNGVKVTSHQSPVTSKECRLLKGIPDDAYFYFCHSYYVLPEDKNIITLTTDYGIVFTSMIWKENLFAVQFHPEKSQEVGLKILENFSLLKSL